MQALENVVTDTDEETFGATLGDLVALDRAQYSV